MPEPYDACPDCGGCWDCGASCTCEGCECTLDEPDRYERTEDDLPATVTVPIPVQLATVAGRPARLVSFEQEFGGDAGLVASRLYHAGLTSDPRVYGYHSGVTDWLHVEDDGSVDGEIIFSRLRLDEPAIARRTDEALTLIGQLIREERVAELDSRCGFHVHVGLGYDPVRSIPCYTMDACESLYHLGCHVEDVVYRLASANWRTHRTESGNSYAGPIRKGLAGPVAIGQRFERDRNWLNLMPFLGSRGACYCGAFSFGRWADCTCELSKPTAEFRVFNATANKRKVRAYVALSLALVAYAEQNGCEPGSFPVREWRGTHGLITEHAEPVLRFILRDLPLSDDEREDIRYCAESSMRGGLGSLAPIVRTIRRRKGYRLGLGSGLVATPTREGI